MDCKRADEYFMKYMDNSLTTEEAQKLHKHLNICQKCAEDFKIYDSIITELTSEELTEAPEGFELSVMEKIKALPSVTESVNKQTNVLLTVAGAGFFAILALGFIIFLNRDIILETMSAYPSLAPYVSALTPVSDFVTSFIDNTWNVALGASETLFSFVYAYKYVVLITVVVFLAIQITMIRNKHKDKVED